MRPMHRTVKNLRGLCLLLRSLRMHLHHIDFERLLHNLLETGFWQHAGRREDACLFAEHHHEFTQ